MDRLQHLTSWSAEWTGLRVVVVGTDARGFSAADTLVELGATVVVVDDAASVEQRRLLEVIGAEYREGALGDAPALLHDGGWEVLVTSPRLEPGHPLHRWAEEGGVAVWSDVELAWRVRDKVDPAAEWLAVTGSSGKSTTAQLTTHLLEAASRRVALVGAEGIPILDAVRYPAGFDVLVVELSSRELHWLGRTPEGTLSPWSSVCLGVADHLDGWHETMDDLRTSLGRVYANTRTVAIYNTADDATLAMVEDAEVIEGCRAIGFGLGAPGPSDFGVVDGILCDRAFLTERATTALELSTRMELASVGLGAAHTVANVLAAAALARSTGAEPRVVREAILSFRLHDHSSAVVADAEGVLWIDDSRATTVHSAAAALRAYRRVVWVLGGVGVGVADAVGTVIESERGRLAAVILIGVARDALRAAFERHAPEVPVFEVDSPDTEDVMPTAVALSAAVARPGDAVLLAPAAASMDQFIDYADRGSRFAEAVRHHLGGGADDHHPTLGTSDGPNSGD
ncbi:UDP-N-acetylmuramoylalanine--D-glutamate ligase [Galbitalea soli]|nr:UDP-N-acetylmuramoylalanine--D-glutamate ligase [Galbitalea soli]